MSSELKVGGDPRTLPDYVKLRDELAKLLHPARPDVDWQRVEQLSLSLFQQNGVELQTLCWYTLSRMHLTGIVGLNEGLVILETMLTHQWGNLWPVPVHARLEILTVFSQRLQVTLRACGLKYTDLSQLYQAEQHLTRLYELLQRLALKDVSQLSALLTFMHNVVMKLENQGVVDNSDDFIAANITTTTVTPRISSLGRLPDEPEPEPVKSVIIADKIAPIAASTTDNIATLSEQSVRNTAVHPAVSFAAGMLTMLLLCSLALWGWGRLHPVRQQTVSGWGEIASLQELEHVSPIWRQHYGFQLANQAPAAERDALQQQWQYYLVGNALPTEKLSGWHQGMEGLQILANRLNTLDERRGKYLTGSELKSMVFTSIQHFERAIPVEEQLYRLSQTDKTSESFVSQQVQTDIQLNQLLNRYALLLESQKLGNNRQDE